MWQQANNRARMPENARTHLTQPQYRSRVAATADLVPQRNARTARQVNTQRQGPHLALTAWLDTRTQTVMLEHHVSIAMRASTLQQHRLSAQVVLLDMQMPTVIQQASACCVQRALTHLRWQLHVPTALLESMTTMCRVCAAL